MVSERGVRITHSVLFTLTTLAAIVVLAISASLVAHYNSEGYPPVHTNAYRDRIRILLAAGIWTTFMGLLLTVGFHVAGQTVVFGILTHLIPVVIAFILFIIGASSLTALTDKIDCSKAADAFDRCNIVKGLVIISWIDTIFVFLTLIFIVVLCFIARSGFGVRRSTLYVD
ncbi:hypothetical protein JCM24511_05170 [Saitozyma sp. JCM 24511]|nr:hypothetical protein JCM24511_05170 [Saitozyma sp. JCM 24511]